MARVHQAECDIVTVRVLRRLGMDILCGLTQEMLSVYDECSLLNPFVYFQIILNAESLHYTCLIQSLLPRLPRIIPQIKKHTQMS
jgi:hypothetical protein